MQETKSMENKRTKNGNHLYRVVKVLASAIWLCSAQSDGALAQNHGQVSRELESLRAAEAIAIDGILSMAREEAAQGRLSAALSRLEGAMGVFNYGDPPIRHAIFDLLLRQGAYQEVVSRGDAYLQRADDERIAMAVAMSKAELLAPDYSALSACRAIVGDQFAGQTGWSKGYHSEASPRTAVLLTGLAFAVRYANDPMRPWFLRRAQAAYSQDPLVNLLLAEDMQQAGHLNEAVRHLDTVIANTSDTLQQWAKLTRDDVTQEIEARRNRGGG